MLIKNALAELEKEFYLNVLSWNDVLCADIEFDPYEELAYYKQNKEKYIPKQHFYLVKNYKEDQLSNFKNTLSKINYNSEYGALLLWGTIWLKDNTWFERKFIDHLNYECWELKCCPLIPNYLDTEFNV